MIPELSGVRMSCGHHSLCMGVGRGGTLDSGGSTGHLARLGPLCGKWGPFFYQLGRTTQRPLPGSWPLLKSCGVWRVGESQGQAQEAGPMGWAALAGVFLGRVEEEDGVRSVWS